MTDPIALLGPAASDWFDSPPFSARLAFEGRVGLENLEMLQHMRRAIAAQIAPLDREHSGGMPTKWDHRRKSLLAKLRANIRMGTVKGVKLTVDAIDDMARSDPQYEAFLKAGDEAADLLYTLETYLAEVNERIADRIVMAKVHTGEAYLTG